MKYFQYRSLSRLFCVLALTCLVAACQFGFDNQGPLTVNTQSANAGADLDVDQDCEALPGADTFCSEAPETNTEDQADGDTTTSSITRGNAASVVNNTLSIAELIHDFGQTGGAVISSVRTGDQAGSLFELLSGLLVELNDQATEQGLDLPTVLGVVSNPLLLTCEEGGGGIGGGQVSPIEQSPSVIRFQIDSGNRCAINGVSIWGSFSISEFGVNGNPSLAGTEWDLSALYTFEDFSLAFADGVPFQFTGSLRIFASSDGIEETGGAVVDTPLGITVGGQTETLRSEFGIDYTLAVATLSLDVFGSYSSSRAEGILTVTTNETPLTQQPADGSRYQTGSLTITSNDGSNATMSMANADNVSISINDNSDQIVVTWDTLRSS